MVSGLVARVKGENPKNWSCNLKVDDVFEFADSHLPVALMLRVADVVQPKIYWAPPHAAAAVVLPVPALGDCDVRDVSPEWAHAIRGIDEFKRRQSA